MYSTGGDNPDKFFQELMKTKIQDQIGKLDSMTSNINDVFALLKDELARAENFEQRLQILSLLVLFVRPTSGSSSTLAGSGVGINI